MARGTDRGEPSTGGLGIRHAAETDLDDLVEQTWQVAAEGGGIGLEVPFDRDVRREKFEAALAESSSTVLVAMLAGEEGPTMAGHIWLSVAPYGVADVGMLVVEQWRAKGIGRALLSAGTDWAMGAGAHKMSLEVWPHNDAAIRLYRSAGFVEEGRRARHYRRRNGELWDSLIMGRHLHPG